MSTFENSKIKATINNNVQNNQKLNWNEKEIKISFTIKKIVFVFPYYKEKIYRIECCQLIPFISLIMVFSYWDSMIF